MSEHAGHIQNVGPLTPPEQDDDASASGSEHDDALSEDEMLGLTADDENAETFASEPSADVSGLSASLKLIASHKRPLDPCLQCEKRGIECVRLRTRSGVVSLRVKCEPCRAGKLRCTMPDGSTRQRKGLLSVPLPRHSTDATTLAAGDANGVVTASVGNGVHTRRLAASERTVLKATFSAPGKYWENPPAPRATSAGKDKDGRERRGADTRQPPSASRPASPMSTPSTPAPAPGANDNKDGTRDPPSSPLVQPSQTLVRRPYTGPDYLFSMSKPALPGKFLRKTISMPRMIGSVGEKEKERLKEAERERNKESERAKELEKEKEAGEKRKRGAEGEQEQPVAPSPKKQRVRLLPPRQVAPDEGKEKEKEKEKRENPASKSAAGNRDKDAAEKETAKETSTVGANGASLSISHSVLGPQVSPYGGDSTASTPPDQPHSGAMQEEEAMGQAEADLRQAIAAASQNSNSSSTPAPALAATTTTSMTTTTATSPRKEPLSKRARLDDSARTYTEKGSVPAANGIDNGLAKLPASVHPAASVHGYREDGSIVLLVGDTLFKIVRSRLEEGSKLFRDLFSDAIDADVQVGERLGVMSDGCPLYRVNGVEPGDFDELIFAMDNGIAFVMDPPSFSRLAALLRAAYSLRIPTYLAYGQQRLRALWPSSLDAISPTPLADAAEALALARKCGVPEIRKRALYELLRSPEGIFAGKDMDAMQLMRAFRQLQGAWIEAGSTPPDSARCLSERERGREKDKEREKDVARCADARARNMEIWSRKVLGASLFREGLSDPLCALRRLEEMGWRAEGYCERCVEARRKLWRERREQIWEELDGWLGLGSE